jgi:hypothetical protein
MHKWSLKLNFYKTITDIIQMQESCSMILLLILGRVGYLIIINYWDTKIYEKIMMKNL